MLVWRNVFANYLGQAWRVGILLVFVPIYVSYLGVEAYGLVGVFATLQAWLSLVDMGARPALAREMARFSAGVHDQAAAWDLLRTMEVLCGSASVVVVLVIWGAAPWLSAVWLKPQFLSGNSVQESFSLMGVVIGARLLENVYSGTLAGLQQQVRLNAASMLIQALQAGATIVTLAFVTSTIEAFFACQAVFSLASLIVMAIVVYFTLPATCRKPRFSSTALREVARFAVGMMAISATTLMLTQLDKVLLSHWLPLEAFGIYTLASLVASGLDLFTAPIAGAMFPHFVELITRKDDLALRLAYHRGAQVVSIGAGAVAAVLVTNAEPAMFVWTGDRALARNVAPILEILTTGTLLHCFMWIPYQLQLAHGWTQLAIKANLIAALVLVPTLIVVAPLYGAVGVAAIWLTLNLGYLVVVAQVMHRRLLPQEKWVWYGQDLALPVGVAFAAAFGCRLIGQQDDTRMAEAATLAATLAVTLIASISASPLARGFLCRIVLASARKVRK